MVSVVQLVERWIVVPEVAGSKPVIHPNRKIARKVRDLFAKQRLRLEPASEVGTHIFRHYVRVMELEYILDLSSKFWEFKSPLGYQCGRLA